MRQIRTSSSMSGRWKRTCASRAPRHLSTMFGAFRGSCTARPRTEPGYRFYLLYDKLYREDILIHAYHLAKANGGAAGVDGVGFEHIEQEGVGTFLAKLREELKGQKI